MPVLPSVTDESPIETDGGPWTRNVATRVPDVAPSVIATVTFRVLPAAFVGTTSATRAVPPLNDCVF